MTSILFPGEVFVALSPMPSAVEGRRTRHFTHVPERPLHAYRESLDRFGICICWQCCRRMPSVAWHGDNNARALLGANAHTETWRDLSGHAGDAWANWLCIWCDLQPEPEESAAALLALAALSWETVRREPATAQTILHTRDVLLDYLERS